MGVLKNYLNKIHCTFIITLLLCAFTGCYRSNYGPPTEVAKNYAIKKYALTIAKQHSFNLLMVNDVTSNYSAYYCMAFTSDQQLSLEQGKALAIPIVYDFLQMLSQDPAVKAYCDHEIQTSKYRFASPPRPQNIGLKIAFWDQNVNRPKNPYLAEIMFESGFFHYYEADPDTQALRLIHKEAFDESIDSTQNKRKNATNRITGSF